jgi:hypothetical protein
MDFLIDLGHFAVFIKILIIAYTILLVWALVFFCTPTWHLQLVFHGEDNYAWKVKSIFLLFQNPKSKTPSI